MTSHSSCFALVARELSRHSMKLCRSRGGRASGLFKSQFFLQTSLYAMGGFEAAWDMFSTAARNFQKHNHRCCANQQKRLPRDDIDKLQNFARTVFDLDDWRRVWLKNASLLFNYCLYYGNSDSARPATQWIKFIPFFLSSTTGTNRLQCVPITISLSGKYIGRWLWKQSRFTTLCLS